MHRPAPARPGLLLALAGTLALATVPGAATFHWVALLVVAPIAEEVVFRAGLHDALLHRWHDKGGFATVLVNVVTAIAFAAAHVAARGDIAAAATLWPALAIGWLYQKQRRLVPCIALHALFNGVWIAWIAA